jgi:hypothetical protein
VSNSHLELTRCLCSSSGNLGHSTAPRMSRTRPAGCCISLVSSPGSVCDSSYSSSVQALHNRSRCPAPPYGVVFQQMSLRGSSDVWLGRFRIKGMVGCLQEACRTDCRRCRTLSTVHVTELYGRTTFRCVHSHTDDRKWKCHQDRDLFRSPCKDQHQCDAGEMVDMPYVHKLTYLRVRAGQAQSVCGDGVRRPRRNAADATVCEAESVLL